MPRVWASGTEMQRAACLLGSNGFAFTLTVAGTGYPTVQIPGFCLLKVLPLHYGLQEAVAVGCDVGATARCRCRRRRCCCCRAF